jgi:hypothetical protein
MDGHAKALPQGVLEESATSEDGNPLDLHSQFVLWNRF